MQCPIQCHTVPTISAPHERPHTDGAADGCEALLKAAPLGLSVIDVIGLGALEEGLKSARKNIQLLFWTDAHRPI